MGMEIQHSHTARTVHLDARAALTQVLLYVCARVCVYKERVDQLLSVFHFCCLSRK